MYVWSFVTSPQPRPARTRLAICTRTHILTLVVSSAHELPGFFRDSYIEAFHEPQQHLRSLVCEVPHSQVQRVRLGGDHLHCELASAQRLLEPQALDLDVLRSAQPCAAHNRQRRTRVDAQPNRHGSTQVLGKRLNSRRLCSRTFARRCWWPRRSAASSKL